MKIYQNTGINEREKAIFPNETFYEQIMDVKATRFTKKGYRGKKVVGIELKGTEGEEVLWELVGEDIYNPLLKETKSKGLTLKKRLSNLVGKEIIVSLVKKCPERVIGIRPIRKNETFKNEHGQDIDNEGYINVIKHNKNLFPKAYFCD